jgi:hypothetical protein
MPGFSAFSGLAVSAAVANDEDVQSHRYKVDVPIYSCTTASAGRMAVVKISSMGNFAQPVIETFEGNEPGTKWFGVRVDLEDVILEAGKFCRTGASPYIYRLAPPPGPR